MLYLSAGPIAPLSHSGIAVSMFLIIYYCNLAGYTVESFYMGNFYFGLLLKGTLRVGKFTSLVFYLLDNGVVILRILSKLRAILQKIRLSNKQESF